MMDPETVVHVVSRTWPGMQKEGGRAKIVGPGTIKGTYNVRYVLGGGDKDVHPAYLGYKHWRQNTPKL